MLEVQKLLGEGDLFDLISVLRRLGQFALTIMVTGLAVCAILYQMQHVQSINIFATRDVRLFSSEPQSMSASESGHSNIGTRVGLACNCRHEKVP